MKFFSKVGRVFKKVAPFGKKAAPFVSIVSPLIGGLLTRAFNAVVEAKTEDRKYEVPTWTHQSKNELVAKLIDEFNQEGVQMSPVQLQRFVDGVDKLINEIEIENIAV